MPWQSRMPAWCLLLRCADLWAATVTFRVTENDAPVPCRIHCRDAEGVAHTGPGLFFWRDHFVCPGQAELSLPPGGYAYVIERGPEYRAVTGRFDVSTADRPIAVECKLQRIADLSARGWWSGDLHVHRAGEEIPLHLQAEDLHVAPVITWWNDRRSESATGLGPNQINATVDGDRWYNVMAGEDEREGGALLYFGLPEPLPLPARRGIAAEYPSPLEFASLARKHAQVYIDIEKPFWWDVPIWIALADVDSIGLANNHMWRSSMYPRGEAWGKPRDMTRFPQPRDNGFWTQEIYYHLLNSGLRIPPSAGSASGVHPNPVGYNRVYVHLPNGFDPDQWWSQLRAGRSFVTNGPLLLGTANGRLPGHVFQSDGPLPVDLRAELWGNDHVPDMEIIHNGEVVQRIKVDAGQPIAGRLTFTESGWFLMRAIADNPRTFRFASTAPFYVEIGGTSERISRASVEFFRSWVAERMGRVPLTLSKPEQLDSVLHYHRQAQQFWNERLERATAD